MSFYIQDSRSYVGNDVLWWIEGGKGYTTDLSKAGKFSLALALAQNRCRPTDIPWPCSYIDSRTRPAVDIQYLNWHEASSGMGIMLQKPQAAPKPERYKCEGCGVFMSDAGRYCAPCAKCGTDNRP